MKYSFPDKYVKYFDCIRCGTKENLIPYEHLVIYHESRGANLLTFKHSATIPTCEKCASEFEEWESAMARRNIKFCVACFLFIAICVGLIFVLNFAPFFVNILYINGMVAFFVVCWIKNRKSFDKGFKQSSNPSKYIEIKKGGYAIVTPQGAQYSFEYEDWVRTVIELHNREIVSEYIESMGMIAAPGCCEQCGSKMAKDARFCMECGVNLT